MKDEGNTIRSSVKSFINFKFYDKKTPIENISSDLWSVWSHGRAGDPDQRRDLLVLSAPPYDKMAHHPSCWMQKLLQSKSDQASGSPAEPW